MANTPTAVYQQNGAASIKAAFTQTPQTGTQNLDLLQIVGQGQNVLVNVDWTGAVHSPASAATTGTRIGVFETNLTSSATTAQLFASAFKNLSQQDILQNLSQGGTVTYWLDYLGVSHGS